MKGNLGTVQFLEDNRRSALLIVMARSQWLIFLCTVRLLVVPLQTEAVLVQAKLEVSLMIRAVNSDPVVECF